MLETITYSRKTAVEEGLRKSVEIDKGDFKRPIMKFMRYKPYKEVGNAISNIFSTVPSALKRGSVSVSGYLKDDENKMAAFNSLGKVGTNMCLEDIISTETFKKKSIYVYVEKQHKDTYTLRCLSKNLPFVADIKLDDFYDIAGRSLMMYLSKANGVYTVNRIIKVLKD